MIPSSQPRKSPISDVLYHRETCSDPTNSYRFIQDVYKNLKMTIMLRRTNELLGHEGCVNALYWSTLGLRLISGSDDTKVCIWDATSDFALSCKIATGHRANIFSTKFMPVSNDSTIVSAAGDSEIRIHEISYPKLINSNKNNEFPEYEVKLTRVYQCHQDRAKRIALFDQDPFTFLSCSEDGTVRHFDLRLPHICSTQECPKPLLDYGKYRIDLNGLSLNRKRPEYLAVGGTSPYIYLHDRRMIKEDKINCVNRFSPSNFKNKRSGHITAVKFSETNSHELLGSWSQDHGYLFDIFQETSPKNESYILPINSKKRQRSRELDSVSGKKNHLTSLEQDEGLITLSNRGASLTESPLRVPSTSSQDSTNDSNKTDQNDVSELIGESGNDDSHTDSSASSFMETPLTFHSERSAQAAGLMDFRMRNDFDQAIQDFTDQIRFQNEAARERRHSSSFIISWTQQQRIDRRRSRAYRNRAISRFKRGHREDIETGIKDAIRATIINPEEPKNWWIRGVGNWIMAEKYPSDDSYHEHSDYTNLLQEAERCANEASSMVSRKFETLIPSSPERDELESLEDKLRRFKAEIRKEVSIDDLLDENVESDTEWDLELEVDSDTESETEAIQTIEGVAVDSSDETVPIDDDNEVDDDDDDNQSDHEQHGWMRRPNIHCEKNSLVLNEIQSFVGHCNVQTVKDINFYGPNDEYVVSGSDDGNFFIWRKKDGRLKQILKGDQDVVNVIEGHPFEPTLAVSGIDSTVKIFQPRSDDKRESLMGSCQRIKDYNERTRKRGEADTLLTRGMLAALAARIRNEHTVEGVVGTGCLLQ